MNKLILILILTLAILVLGSILLISMIGPKKEPEPVEPVISFTPSPSKTAISSPTTPKILKLVAVTPPEDTNQTYFPIKQIFFTFSEPMNPTTFVVESSPVVKIITTLQLNDPNTVVVSPQEKWRPGITTITILPTTTSSSGSRLDQPIVYKINTQFPENPPPDSPGL